MTQPSLIRILCAAAGGLVGAAFLPAAVAVADDYTITPGSRFPGTGDRLLRDRNQRVPTDATGPVHQRRRNSAVRLDRHDNSTSGTFNADVSISTNMSGATTTEVMVAPGDYSDPNTPPVGSVFDIATNNRNANYTFYQDLKGATAKDDAISYYSHNAFGEHDLYTRYDAASVTPTNEFSLGNGYTIDAAPASDPGGGYDITGINGLPPDDMVDQGSQLFYVENPSGNVVGSFEALKTTTSDLAGSYTQALLVTQDLPSTAPVGTALGDVPNVGSVYNTFTIGGIESIYQDLTPTTAGGKDVITYGFGSPSNTNGFDAAGAPALGRATVHTVRHRRPHRSRLFFPRSLYRDKRASAL